MASAVSRMRFCAHCNTQFEVRAPSSSQRFCTRRCGALSRSNGKFRSVRAKSGKRPDLNRFFRSAWEANYARYLNVLKKKKVIHDWDYEAKTFTFNVQRGNRSYTPDFKVYLTPTTYEWHEVKGWMDNDSRVKLKRFAKYYPNEDLVLIDKDMYRKIEAEYASAIPNWE
jgi:hypothetical protein